MNPPWVLTLISTPGSTNIVLQGVAVSVGTYPDIYPGQHKDSATGGSGRAGIDLDRGKVARASLLPKWMSTSDVRGIRLPPLPISAVT